MKIGEFAKRFDLNVSTVRFYVNQGLLLPRKSGEQLKFDGDCVNDMKNLLRYKGFHFTLDEIKLLFFMERASKFNDDIVLKICADIMQSKLSQLVEEKHELELVIEELTDEMKALPERTPNVQGKRGVPFAFVPNLYCPDCDSPLDLKEAAIVEGLLTEGKLSCECGYEATIQDGIITCDRYSEETPLMVFDIIRSVSTTLDQFSPLYRSLMNKAYQVMYSEISDRPEDSRLMMVGPFAYNFIMSFIDKISRKNVIVITDPSRQRIESIMNYLSGRDDNVVYIVGEPGRLPIKKGSIDVYIDDYSTTNGMIAYNEWITPIISELIKNNGQIVGLYSDYKNAPKSLKEFTKAQEGYRGSRMTIQGLKLAWSDEGVSFETIKSMGSTKKNKLDYKQDVLGESIETIAYVASKSGRR